MYSLKKLKNLKKTLRIKFFVHKQCQQFKILVRVVLGNNM